MLARRADQLLGVFQDLVCVLIGVVIFLLRIDQRVERADRSQLIGADAARQQLVDAFRGVEAPTFVALDDGEGDRPFLRADQPAAAAGGEPAEVAAAITHALTLARGRISPRAQLLGEVLIALETAAADSAGNFAAAVLSAREIYGARTVDNAGVMPLYDALDQARILIASSIHQVRAAPAVRARALRVLSTAHQRLVGATTGLVLEAVAPFTDRLRDTQAVTGELRDAVAAAERRRADLERKFATIVDPNLPWGARGNTEW